MATYKYYQPNEVIFREGYNNHTSTTDGQEWTETGGEYNLENFFASDGDVPDKDEHDLFFLDTTVLNTGDGKKPKTDIQAQKQKAIALFKGDKPVTVDYKYVMNPPKIKVKDYGLSFDSLFSGYVRKE